MFWCVASLYILTLYFYGTTKYIQQLHTKNISLDICTERVMIAYKFLHWPIRFLFLMHGLLWRLWENLTTETFDLGVSTTSYSYTHLSQLKKMLDIAPLISKIKNWFNAVQLYYNEAQMISFEVLYLDS